MRSPASVVVQLLAKSRQDAAENNSTGRRCRMGVSTHLVSSVLYVCCTIRLDVPEEIQQLDGPD